jgi:hypothetical protein
LIDRAAIFDALYQRLVDKVVDVKFPTRNWISAADLGGTSRLPAMEFTVGGFRNENFSDMPPKCWLEAIVVFYVRKSQQFESIDQVLELCRQVDGAISAQPSERTDSAQTTLDGLVERAWITRADFMEGDVAGIAAAQIHIEMLITESN